MLLLVNTTDSLQLVTSAAVNVDVHASFVDLASGVTTPDRKNTAITTATTTTIVSAPGSSVYRNIQTLTIRNKGAANQDVTVVYNANSTLFELHKATLLPGQVLIWLDGVGFVILPASTSNRNFSTSSQTGFSSNTYLSGSYIKFPIPPGVGVLYEARFDITKTNVGTAAPIIYVRVGTTGTISDTARHTFTFGAGTAAADVAWVCVRTYFRTVGSGTSAVLQGVASAITNLSTTGWSNAVKNVLNTSGGFDSTVADLGIGISYNGGASAVHTIQSVEAHLHYAF
jgi:hypothetical protein